MATVLVIEDEALTAGEIGRALTRLGHTAIESVDSSDAALQVLGQQRVEIVFIEINIRGDRDGVAVALLVRRQFAVPVVFLAAHCDSATLNRAKLAQPCGYLLKPFSDDALRIQLEMSLYMHYMEQLARTNLLFNREATTAATSTHHFQHLFVRKGAGFVRVLIADILYFESLQNYVRLHTASEMLVFESTLKELEPKLPTCFFKTHRSYIVNLNHVKAYENGCLLIGKGYVAVSRSCKEELKNRIHLLG